MLDSAFKRAGRFDLKLAVGLPDLTGRRNILNIHSRDKKLNPEVDLDVIAKKTVGFSGAELETLLNESALIAVGKEKETIDYSDIDDAYFKIVMQGNKKRRDKITEVNRIVAWHESGHTLATKLLTDDSVSSVTIVGSSSGAGGVTFRNPKDDNILHSKKYLEDSIKIMYAGRAAEEIYLNDKDSITTGASQDIKQATSILKEYLSIYGMGDIGMIDLSQFRQDYGDVVKEATEMSKKLYQDVLDLLRNNYDTLQRLSYKLLEKETLDEMEIDAIIRDETHS
jgi:cell division protease FtsH